MNHQLTRTLQDTRTALAPAEVLAAAKQFFSRRVSIYAAFLEREGPTFVAMRGQGGEELLIGVHAIPGGTAVTGSSYLFDMQIARFFASLPPAPPAAEPAPEAIESVAGDVPVAGSGT